MTKKLANFTLIFVWLVLLQTILLNDLTVAQDHPHEKDHHTGHHEAHHGGVLNVISKCEIGHIEVRVEEDVLEAWFVDGGKNTHRSVPIQADEIALVVTLPDGDEKTLLLKADPMKLAGGKIGYCSRFSTRADWLIEVDEFEACGEIVFKGVHRPLLIQYPAGYAPGHGFE